MTLAPKEDESIDHPHISNVNRHQHLMHIWEEPGKNQHEPEEIEAFSKIPKLHLPVVEER
jgi:hypothetical protein